MDKKCMNIEIMEQRIKASEYIEFLKRTDLGSQYPKERFEERIEKLVNNLFFCCYGMGMQCWIQTFFMGK